MLVDLRPSHPDTTGKDAEQALEDVGLVLNANTVPGETRSPFNPSGIRVGTPGVTTRGMGEVEMDRIAEIIHTVVEDYDDEDVKAEAAREVDELCEQYPLYE